MQAHRTTKEQRLSSPLEEILKRLELLERRMARMEAAVAAGRPAQATSTADALRGAPAQAANSAAPPLPDPRVVAPLRPGAPSATTIAVRTPPPAAAAVDPQRPAPPMLTAADAAITQRLSPEPPRPEEDPFPDLSMLDEKVEPKKGPAEQLDVRAALEDYPRIATRIQQLWGTPECEAYLNNLVIDTRGNRKGFPPPMMEELLYLGRLARALVILGVGGDLWDAYDQIGDRR